MILATPAFPRTRPTPLAPLATTAPLDPKYRGSMRRWVTSVLFTAAAIAVWLVALPAHADSLAHGGEHGRGAPICDERAATMFAPPPQLQDPETSIDLGDAAPEDCAADARFVKHCHEGQAPSQAPEAPEHALGAAIPSVGRPGSVALECDLSYVDLERAGVRATLERPPRG